MKTEIRKSLQFGFVLSEQELRRLTQAIHEHVAKLNLPTVPEISHVAVLKDGSRVESSKIDDLLSLENAGGQAITRVSMSVSDSEAKPTWKIAVEFHDADLNPKTWESITFEVIGESRDWAFVAASDIEDRLRRTKTIAWAALMNSRYGLIVFVLVIMSVIIIAPHLLDASKKSHVLLQELVDSQQVKDPIQALIALEKIKNEKSLFSILAPLISVALAGTFPLWLNSVMPWFSPAYNFYWGDYIAFYDRRKNVRNVVWTVIILGVIVSVIGAIVSKKIGV